MKSYNTIRVVVEFELPNTQSGDLPDIARALEGYVPRLQEDMDEFCDGLVDDGHDGVGATVCIETATVHYGE